MKDRIKKIMESQRMTQQEFAQFIGMSPATLSSIFNDRTKPTINMVEAIKKKIPDISTDWLMFGSGSMYLSDNSSVPPAPTVERPPMSPTSVTQPTLMFDAIESNSPVSQERVSSPVVHSNSVRNTHQEIVREDLKIIDKPLRRVIEIRVFYDDQTWDTFVPAKK